MTRYRILPAILAVFIVTAGILSNAQAGGGFQVRIVEATEGNVPGYTVFAREYADRVSLVEYHVTGPYKDQTFTVKGKDNIYPTSAYEAADWLEIDPAYVRSSMEGDRMIFIINAPAPTWVRVNFGRLEYDANRELTTPYALSMACEILIQSGTWRPTSKYDTSVPLKSGLTNDCNIGDAAAPPDSDPSGFSVDMVRTWCTKACPQLKGDDLTNPDGSKYVVLAYDGACYHMDVPAGVFWDDAKGRNYGPIHLPVCTPATFYTN